MRLLFTLTALFCLAAPVRAAASDDLDDRRAVMEIKYTAGADGKWFTPDDEVYHFFTAEYDGQGRMIRKSCLKTGPDRLPGTPDDELQEYQVYQTAVGAKSGEDSTCTPAGAVKTHSVYYFDRRGRKIREVRSDAAGTIVRVINFQYEGGGASPVRDVECTGKGPDGRWATADDDIEKYHCRYYSPEGRLIRMTECHRAQDGRGPDGKWFTRDDVVSSTREFVYEDGRVSKVLKSIGAGPDGAWFTGDEKLQYYTVRVYAPYVPVKEK